MTSRDASALKTALQAAVDERLPALIELAHELDGCPELGFKEHRTASILAGRLRALGLSPDGGLARTGLRARIQFAQPGPRVAVLSELDALPVPNHPRADPVTGAVHACGHNLQMAQMIGVAAALVAAGQEPALAGSVDLFAVPAEEYVDLDWRFEQVARGTLLHASGKQELIARGAFDDVDIAMMVHASARSEDRSLAFRHGNNGFLVKEATFVGRSAHAAAGPHLGINALTAARLAMQAIDAQRETFPEDARVRVHGILPEGGVAPNVVPDRARVQLFVRAAELEAILEAETKVDRSFRAGALATGASVQISTQPGYLPVRADDRLVEIFRENARELVGADGWADRGPIAGSTDIGDLSHLMPVIHPYHGGCAGANHSASFAVADHAIAIGAPAKAMLGTIVDLLSDGAPVAREVIERFEAPLTRDSYLAELARAKRTETWPEEDDA